MPKDSVSNLAVNHLTLQFLDWIAERPRPYAEVMDAWRSSCPRLSIWEDCQIAGLVRHEGTGPARHVTLTPLGRARLARPMTCLG